MNNCWKTFLTYIVNKVYVFLKILVSLIPTPLYPLYLFWQVTINSFSKLGRRCMTFLSKDLLKTWHTPFKAVMSVETGVERQRSIYRCVQQIKERKTRIFTTGMIRQYSDDRRQI